MLIKTLVENITTDKKIKAQHGLSLYIEADHHKILFDLGRGSLFIRNAQRLGVDLKAVDTVVISHGHSDHGGALKRFLTINSTAKIYIHKNAFDKHIFKQFGLKLNVGLDQTLQSNRQIIFVEDFFKITDNLMLFGNVKGRTLFSPANDALFKRIGGAVVPDDFGHEQNLIIIENNKVVLLSGCCHNGIINTLNRMSELSYEPDYVISGMHFLNLGLRKYGGYIDEVANRLHEKKAVVYTCHCTGYSAYERMKERMGTKINYLTCGTTLTL